MKNKYPYRASDVAYRVLDGETVLVTAKEGKIYSLNSVGTKILEMADGTNSISDIISTICQVFEGQKEQVSADSVEFIGELAGKGILELRDDGITAR